MLIDLKQLLATLGMVFASLQERAYHRIKDKDEMTVVKLRSMGWAAAIAMSLLSQAVTAASITYNTWTTNEGLTGNYILTVDNTDVGEFNFNLTVNPWNAEVLGLFIDLGDVDIFSPFISNITPANSVFLVNLDTESDGCGTGGGGGGGCNLNGLEPPVADPDGEWELVFRMGQQGFDGIQTFDWTVSGLSVEQGNTSRAITLDDFGLVGMRSQQLCSGNNTLDNGDDGCGDSDKSYGYGSIATPNPVPLPAAVWLFGSALIGAGVIGRRKKKKA